MMIEDEQRLATSVKRGLEAEGFTVDLAFNGTDGLERAVQPGYDVIVCDIMLPGVNGFKLCTRLREAGMWTPLLMLTAKDGDLDEAEALDSGADDWLTKPFSFVVLVARLRALVRRGNSRDRQDVLTVGDLTVDRAGHRCRRGDVDIELTQRELALIELLMRRAGQVLSKRDILDELWDPSFDGDPNIVEVYVARLRRKLDTSPGHSCIQTVRGAGYRLEPNPR